jgi:hypothetical protein
MFNINDEHRRECMIQMAKDFKTWKASHKDELTTFRRRIGAYDTSDLEQAMMTQYMVPAKYLPLNHVQRFNHMDYFNVIEQSYGMELIESVFLAARYGVSLLYLAQYLVDFGSLQTANLLLDITTGVSGSEDYGNLYAGIFPLYCQYRKVRRYQCSEPWIDKAEQVDLTQIRVCDLMIPTPCFYLQFFQPDNNGEIKAPYVVYNNISGEHQLESCYVSQCSNGSHFFTEQFLEISNIDSVETVMSFDVMFIGTPKDNIGDDASHFIRIFYDKNSTMSLSDLIYRTIDNNSVGIDEFFSGVPMDANESAEMLDCLTLLFKSLVALQFKETSINPMMVREPLKIALKNAKGYKKINLAKEKLNNAVDFDVVS